MTDTTDTTRTMIDSINELDWFGNEHGYCIVGTDNRILAHMRLTQLTGEHTGDDAGTITPSVLSGSRVRIRSDWKDIEGDEVSLSPTDDDPGLPGIWFPLD